MYLWGWFLGVLRQSSMSLILIVSIIFSASLSAYAVSHSDAKIAKLAFQAIDAKKPNRALKLAAKLKNSIAKKTITWYVFKNASFKTPYNKVLEFITREPEWPQQQKLQISAEEALPNNISTGNIIKFFRKKTPISTTGKIKFIRALLKIGKKNQAIKLIKSTWISGNFGKNQERGFYRSYRSYLSRKDNWKRLDNLLWLGRYWPVRRMLWKVNKDYRALAVARMLLRHRRGNVDQGIAQVPKHLKNDLGLIYERLRWRRKKGKINEAIKLLRGLPEVVPHAERWWKERSFLARKKLRKGHISEAYRITKDHGVKSGAAFADGEWMSGWIALRFLNDYEAAKIHFVKLYRVVKYPVSRARGAYWVARTYDSLKDKRRAKKWYKTAANYPTTYYGQLAVAKLGTGKGLEFPTDPKISHKMQEKFNVHELTRVIKFLDNIGERKRLKPFIRRLAEINPKPGWKVLTGNLSRKYGRLDQSIGVAKTARQNGILLIDIGYPVVSLPKVSINKKGFISEHPLILAMIRQESAFYIRAKSHAGARGLLQLMPKTAKKMAQEIGISYSKKRLTTDPAYNLNLGQHYIQRLLDKFKGSYIMAITAYNAGPSRVWRWSKNFGDPRKRDVDPIDWIEMIPFEETRNYVQRVLENLQVYRVRLSTSQVTQTLEGDLNR